MLNKLKFLFLLILALHIAVLAQFAGGSGTEEDPWLIRTASNLDSIRYYLGTDYADKYFLQTENIDLGVAPWNVGEGWEPIGNDSTAFDGNYDGNGFQISNLTINRPEQDFIGLFGFCDWSMVQNIKLINISITGRNSVGGLVGYGYATSNENCHTTGEISGVSNVGGIIGTADWYLVLNCYTTSDVSGTDNIGGILGKSTDMPYFDTIVKSYSIGTVTGDDNVGGLIGNDENADTRFCYWNTETSGQNSSAGGEGRRTDEMTYDYSSDTYEYWNFDNIWTEDLENTNNGYPFLQSDISGLCPTAPSNLIADTQNGVFSVDLSWTNPDTLINGDLLTDLDTVYLYRDFDIIKIYTNPTAGEFISITDTVLVNGEYTYKVVGENSNGLGICARLVTPLGELFAGGTGTELDPYLVSTADELNNIRYFTGKNSVYFLQTANIDLGVIPWNEEKGWIPIGHYESEFTGNYNGGEYFSISNITINDSTANYASLFGAIRNANINNVQLENVNIVGYLGCGALIGNSFTSNISNCSSTGIVTGLEEVGGLLGVSVDTSILNCYSQADVYGTEYLGGLIGHMVEFMGSDSGRVANSYATGSVEGESKVGGLIGIMGSPITNCYSTGSVVGNSEMGGLVGSGYSTATNCYWDIESSGQTTSARGLGRTTADMTPPYSDSTYVDWDFENTWSIGYPTKGDYPILKRQTYVSIDDSKILPQNCVLYQNFPNPFNPTTKISYMIPNGYNDNVKLQIFNTKGELVKTLVNKKQNSGRYSVEFNATDLNSGMYFYSLKTLNSTTTKKMILLK
ncbi:MAG: T9SS type A sorting domain-containing protein [Candidatus Delongbacteria bacterium]|nr:T9SS type A sorting domain-containing protein [Candidatus Delongbacteria bacterium]